MKILSLLRALIFQILFWLWGAVCALAMMVCQVFGFGVLVTLKRFWLRTSMLLARAILGVKFSIKGQDKMPQGAVIIAMKHQSIWDALIPGLIFDNPGYVLKEELLKIPLFGALLKKWPIIALQRSASTKALRYMMEKTQELLASRQPQLVIFPEGTRRLPGAEPDYKRGILSIYEASGVPIVPVALNSGLFWGRGFLDFRPGTIELEILPPIEAGLPKAQAFDLMVEAIETRSQALSAPYLTG